MAKRFRPRDGHRVFTCPNWRANLDAGFPCKHGEDAHWSELSEQPCIHTGCRCGGGPGRVVLAHGQETLRFLRMMAQVPHVDEPAVLLDLAPVSVLPAPRRKRTGAHTPKAVAKKKAPRPSTSVRSAAASGRTGRRSITAAKKASVRKRPARRSAPLARPGSRGSRASRAPRRRP